MGGGGTISLCFYFLSLARDILVIKHNNIIFITYIIIINKFVNNAICKSLILPRRVIKRYGRFKFISLQSNCPPLFCRHTVASVQTTPEKTYQVSKKKTPGA